MLIWASHVCLLRDLETVSDLELVEPALARDEVGRGAKLESLVLDHLGSHLLVVVLARVVPLEELFLHFGVFCLAPATFLALPADLHPTLEGLEGNLVLLGAVARCPLSRLKCMRTSALPS